MVATLTATPDSFLDFGRFFENCITKDELKRAIGLSESFINKLMKQGEIPYFKIGRAVRFRVSEVMSWLQKRRMP